MKLALYQPDIPQNLGTLLRMGACLNVEVHIIEPCGFPLDDRKLRRAGMDYIDHVVMIRHRCWDEFMEYVGEIQARLILLTTKTEDSYTDIAYQPHDILLLGRESAGVPDNVAAQADISVTIPMRPPMRSLNVAIAAAMVTGEALRQCK